MSDDELRDLASSLSGLGVAGCDVVILDPSPAIAFDLHARVLRWVGRHVAVSSEYRLPDGAVDVVRAAAAHAACEKVIVATHDVRYTAAALEQTCERLDRHEVVEPQDYLDPLPWWSGLEAARMLVRRGIEPRPDHGATFGFRRSALRILRGLANAALFRDPVRRLGASGAEVHPAADVFVRRQPAPFRRWLEERPRQAEEDFAMPLKTAFFFAIVPFLVVAALLGGSMAAAGLAGIVAAGALALAVRGRIGASAYFPPRACLFAPLWILERSLSVYWALWRQLRGTDAAPAGVAVPDRARGARAASGE